MWSDVRWIQVLPDPWYLNVLWQSGILFNRRSPYSDRFGMVSRRCLLLLDSEAFTFLIVLVIRNPHSDVAKQVFGVFTRISLSEFSVVGGSKERLDSAIAFHSSFSSVECAGPRLCFWVQASAPGPLDRQALIPFPFFFFTSISVVSAQFRACSHICEDLWHP